MMEEKGLVGGFRKVMALPGDYLYLMSTEPEIANSRRVFTSVRGFSETVRR